MKKAAGLNPYAVLGLERDASDAEVKARFRRMALKQHPDKGGSTAGAAAQRDEEAVTGFANLLEFARINAAYEVLADPRRRRQYDDFGAKLQPGVGDGFAAMVQCALRLGRLRRYRGSESCGSCRYGAAGDRRWLGGHHRRHVCVGAVDASDGHVGTASCECG
eukprot:scaffold425_cov373-Pinguiococcus_pyrenoidosus.AAC.6